MNANFKATGAANAATPVAPGEVTDALKQWAWHWFGPDADEAWIAQALANLPAGALSNPAPVAAPALTLKGEVWDDNPDGIVPGQDRGPRMNPDTGFYED
jgi:hypothetical protein